MIKGRIEKKHTKEEKIKRIINLPNRHEIIIEKNNEKIICFSMNHAAKIIGVSFQAIEKALKNKRKSKEWNVIKNDFIFYDKKILMNNLNLFDDNLFPSYKLIEMLQSL